MYKHFYVSGIPNTDGEMIPPDAVDLLDPRTFGVIEITGLYRPTADDYITDLGGIDASVYGGMSVKSRTITLNLDAQTDMERMRLYRVLPYGKPRRFWIETNVGVFWIDGYVTGMPEGSDNNDLIANFDVTIKCPYPWFRSLQAHKYRIYAQQEGIYQQSGDVPAGARIYFLDVSGDDHQYISNFWLQSMYSDNVATFSWSSTVRNCVLPNDEPGLFLDTTPGQTWWQHMSMYSGSTKDFLAEIDLDGEVLVYPEGTELRIMSDTLVNLGSNVEIWLEYFDTYSGV